MRWRLTLYTRLLLIAVWLTASGYCQVAVPYYNRPQPNANRSPQPGAGQQSIPIQPQTITRPNGRRDFQQQTTTDTDSTPPELFNLLPISTAARQKLAAEKSYDKQSKALVDLATAADHLSGRRPKTQLEERVSADYLELLRQAKQRQNAQQNQLPNAFPPQDEETKGQNLIARQNTNNGPAASNPQWQEFSWPGNTQRGSTSSQVPLSAPGAPAGWQPGQRIPGVPPNTQKFPKLPKPINQAANQNQRTFQAATAAPPQVPYAGAGGGRLLAAASPNAFVPTQQQRFPQQQQQLPQQQQRFPQQQQLPQQQQQRFPQQQQQNRAWNNNRGNTNPGQSQNVLLRSSRPWANSAGAPRYTPKPPPPPGPSFPSWQQGISSNVIRLPPKPPPPGQVRQLERERHQTIASAGNPQAPKITKFTINALPPGQAQAQAQSGNPSVPNWAQPRLPTPPIVPTVVQRPQSALTRPAISTDLLQAALSSNGGLLDSLNTGGTAALIGSDPLESHLLAANVLPGVGGGGANGGGIFGAVLKTLSNAAAPKQQQNQLAQLAQLAAANPELLQAAGILGPPSPSVPAVAPAPNLDLISRILEMGLNNIFGAPQIAKSNDPNEPLQSPAAAKPKQISYGNYAGKFTDDRTAGIEKEHNVQGAVWVVNASTLVVSQFTFNPAIVEKENITFWAGPRQKTGDNSEDLFPNENGFYLKPMTPDHLNPAKVVASKPRVIIAKRPTPEQVAKILTQQNKDKERKQESRSERDGGVSKSEPEPSSKPEPEPKAEPEPTGRRRKRQSSYQDNFMDTFVPRGYEPRFVETRSLGEFLDGPPARTAATSTSTAAQRFSRSQPTVKLIVDKGTVRVPSSNVVVSTSAKIVDKSALNQPFDPLPFVPPKSSTSVDTHDHSVNKQPIVTSKVDGGQTQIDSHFDDHQHNRWHTHDEFDDTNVGHSHNLPQLPPRRRPTSTTTTTTTTPATTTTWKPPPVKMEPLTKQYTGLAPVVLTLPYGKSLHDTHWLSVYNHDQKKPIASVLIPNGGGFAIPAPVTVKGLESTGFRDVSSGLIDIIDDKTIRINDFHFEGDAPGAWFMVGKNFLPNPFGQIVPVMEEHRNADGSAEYDCSFVGIHDKSTLILRLPGDMTVRDVFWLSLFCVPYSISFAHVYLPYNDLNVPPDLSGEAVPQCVLENS